MGKTLWGMDAETWDRLRTRSELEVEMNGGPGVRLSGGPLDTWLIKHDAKQLAVGWYATWPITLRRGRTPGYYKLTNGGAGAVWTTLSTPRG